MSASLRFIRQALRRRHQELAVGIVLSGSGSDGTLGLKSIKERGGLTIAQGSTATGPRYPEPRP